MATYKTFKIEISEDELNGLRSKDLNKLNSAISSILRKAGDAKDKYEPIKPTGRYMGSDNRTPAGEVLCPFKGPHGYRGVCSHPCRDASQCHNCRVASEHEEAYG